MGSAVGLSVGALVTGASEVGDTERGLAVVTGEADANGSGVGRAVGFADTGLSDGIAVGDEVQYPTARPSMSHAVKPDTQDGSVKHAVLSTTLARPPVPSLLKSRAMRLAIERKAESGTRPFKPLRVSLMASMATVPLPSTTWQRTPVHASHGSALAPLHTSQLDPDMASKNVCQASRSVLRSVTCGVGALVAPQNVNEEPCEKHAVVYRHTG